ncbi:MAG: hypothetical protein HRU01_06545 [Myxococcales bacterium]|nr:hypothetical protein [Myxococcales bacterium]
MIRVLIVAGAKRCSREERRTEDQEVGTGDDAILIVVTVANGPAAVTIGISLIGVRGVSAVVKEAVDAVEIVIAHGRAGECGANKPQS